MMQIAHLRGLCFCLGRQQLQDSGCPTLTRASLQNYNFGASGELRWKTASELQSDGDSPSGTDKMHGFSFGRAKQISRKRLTF